MSNSKSSIGLNIRGLIGGSGQLNTIPLRVEAETATYIPHRTNYNFTISDPSILNTVSPDSVVIELTDYSSNVYDSYYDPAKKGDTYQSYRLDSNWYIDDVDMIDDIAVIGVKDWTSTEKYTSGIYYPIRLTTDVISNVAMTTTNTTTSTTPACDLYNWTGSWDTIGSNPHGSGYIVVTVTNCDDTTTTTSYYLADSDHLDLVMVSKTQPTYIANGSWPSDPINGSILQDSLNSHTDAVTSSNNCSTGKYKITVWDEDRGRNVQKCASNTFSQYVPGEPFTDYSIDTFTYFNIKGLNDIFQKSIYINNKPANNNGNNLGGLLNSNTPLGQYSTYLPEFPDYSDIFIEINYLTGTLSDNIVVPNGGTAKYIYKFGGFLTHAQYFSKCAALSLSNYQNPKAPNKLTDDSGEFKWYIVYRETSGDYDFVALSSYIVPASIYTSTQLNTLFAGIPLTDDRFKKITNAPVENGSALNPATDGIFLVQNAIISIDAVKVIKVANFGTCGKVDIYKKKTGIISSYTNNDNTITSYSHGLKDGDIVRFSSAMNTDIDNITDLNGQKFISGVTTDTFDIYFDRQYKYAANIKNLRNISGVIWTAEGQTNWQYLHTLYSPQGKNGYGNTEILRTVVESGTQSTNPLERAIESSTLDNGKKKPQSYYNSWISWNNFYPFYRSPIDTILNNGNKFGANCRISKLKDNEYILMVTEPGAEDSFMIFDDYIIKIQNELQGKQSLYPNNHIVIPNYFPYGRIHFYRITKYPYNIEYLKSISANDDIENGWIPYETLNRTNRSSSSVESYDNYPINVTTALKTYNFTTSRYWEGARFTSWAQNDVYNSTYNIGFPDYINPIYANEYAFLDGFGKCAAFELEGSSIYCFTSTNVKDANYGTWDRIANLDATCKTFKYDILEDDLSFNTDIVVQSIPTTATHSTDIQRAEIKNFGFNVDFDNKNLILGWATPNRSKEALYIYDRDDIDYTNKQIITSDGSNGFGDYFVAHNGFLITDKVSNTDDYGNSTSDLSYLYIYKRDFNNGQYDYVQRISPTIDLDNPIYVGYNSSEYSTTQNLSYDNTTGNSATLKISLYGKYDLYNNSLIVRDSKEFAYFTYEGTKKNFVIRNHNFARSDKLPINDCIIRANLSEGSLIGESNGIFIESIQVIDASELLSSIQIITKAYPNLNYLPLTIKSIEGLYSTGITLSTNGVNVYAPDAPTGVYLYTQGPIVHTSGITLFGKQVDPKETGISLFLKQLNLYNESTTLYINDSIINQTLPLFIGSRFYTTFPLTMKTFALETLDASGNPIGIELTDVGSASETAYLFITNSHTGVPNCSGNTNLYLSTYEYDDIGKSVNLAISIDYPSSESGMNLFINNPPGISGYTYDTSTLFIKSPDILYGEPYASGTNLFIKRIMEAIAPLTVYNTYNGTGVDMFVRGAYIESTGLYLSTSGERYPENVNTPITIYTRGTRL